jgi:hypothetical protein
MSTVDLDLRARVLLSVQRALVGCITSEMRFISVEWSPYRIHLHIYVDGPLRAFDHFDAEAVTQIVADFPKPDSSDPQVTFVFQRCDYPRRPEFVGEVVYGRKEERTP